eukprot:scaffold240_cov243-Pinguiococcus_pyrenoidosus.AAC.4
MEGSAEERCRPPHEKSSHRSAGDVVVAGMFGRDHRLGGQERYLLPATSPILTRCAVRTSEASA